MTFLLKDIEIKNTKLFPFLLGEKFQFLIYIVQKFGECNIYLIPKQLQKNVMFSENQYSDKYCDHR